jgi:hypothetical protein
VDLAYKESQSFGLASIYVGDEPIRIIKLHYEGINFCRMSNS